ncbi:RNA polymerase sigma-70 factor [Fulvivirgaceae bacterium BMA10]|uniref:RNA polymerase sigma-70 factor n=1 Tax=Splendidivirga corallicola TaxID=3051826 RepID=A0ABT8KWM6_9BACT|nr:RNA polymerase sigma-70 factor [Fulvivirgaceae bacterium BMA10]
MDDQSFERIFKENFTVLTNIAYSVVKDSDVAKDVVQQVFLKMWRNREGLNVQSSLKNYLHRSVINTSLNHLEKEKRLTEMSEGHTNNLAFAKNDVEQQVVRNEVEMKVKEAVSALPIRCQTVFSLSRFEGLSNKEIADHMDISIKTVENQMGKALKSLRESLKSVLNDRFISVIITIISLMN